jgi:hypothetical protein
MQKVVGSSPISRFGSTCKSATFANEHSANGSDGRTAGGHPAQQNRSHRRRSVRKPAYGQGCGAHSNSSPSEQPSDALAVGRQDTCQGRSKTHPPAVGAGLKTRLPGLPNPAQEQDCGLYERRRLALVRSYRRRASLCPHTAPRALQSAHAATARGVDDRAPKPDAATQTELWATARFANVELARAAARLLPGTRQRPHALGARRPARRRNIAAACRGVGAMNRPRQPANGGRYDEGHARLATARVRCASLAGGLRRDRSFRARGAGPSATGEA